MVSGGVAELYGSGMAPGDPLPITATYAWHVVGTHAVALPIGWHIVSHTHDGITVTIHVRGPVYSTRSLREMIPGNWREAPKRPRRSLRSFPGNATAPMIAMEPVPAPRAQPELRRQHFPSPRVWARRNKLREPIGRRRESRKT